MRSITVVLDQLAAERPQGIWVKTSTSAGGDPKWYDVTFKELADAVNNMAHWIDANLGRSVDNEALTYMGINDIRYCIVILAAIKTGYKPFLSSPRNSDEGHLALLDSTKCKKLLYSEVIHQKALDLAKKHGVLKTIQIMSLTELLSSEPKSRPFVDRSPKQEYDTALILHTSGTTGLPKPVSISAGALAVIDRYSQLPAPYGRRNSTAEWFSSKLMLVPVPMFHQIGILALGRSIYQQGPLLLLPPGRPVDADLYLSAIRTARPPLATAIPSILEDICNVPGGLETLSSLEYLFTGGAPLAGSCGDRIAAKVNLMTVIGTTEVLVLPTYIPIDRRDWQYFEWNVESGFVMEEAAVGLFELVIKRRDDATSQAVFYNFPQLSEWRTKDLFEPHPSKAGLWRYVGRLDDVLVLSNGEKINPVSFEKAIEGLPGVKGALIVGSQRFQAGLIVELQTDERVNDALQCIDQIWPTVEKTNKQYPAHGQDWPSMIRLSTPEKPFVRSAKGSIMRQATYKLYEPEIDDMYAKHAVPNKFDEPPEDHLGNIVKVKDFLRKALRIVTQSDRTDIADDTNFFSLGVDSLQVLQLSNLIIKSLGTKQNARQIASSQTIYRNPSINRLAEAITGALNDVRDANISDEQKTKLSLQPLLTREEKMSAMIHKHTKSLPPASDDDRVDSATEPARHSVILTGSTGSFGTYLLYYLIRNPAVDNIYCFNRSADAARRQSQALHDRGLGTDDLSSEVEFLTTDLSRDYFGLPPSKYQELQQTVNLIIHNAWPVNFNHDLEFFEASIAGTRRCIDFAAPAKHRPRIVFVSSIASVGNWSTVRNGLDKVPEQLDEDNSLPLRQGYGESKHVASVILAKAVRTSGVRATIARMGQIAGPGEGAGVWNKQEWLPSLIATSKALRKIPISIPGEDDIDWIPVDAAAEALLDISIGQAGDGISDGKPLDYFHFVNPQLAHWDRLSAVVCDYYEEQGTPIERVEFDDWVRALKEVTLTPAEIERHPAVKLTEFFDGLSGSKAKNVRLATEATVKASRTMAGLRATDDELMRKWLRSWDF